MGESSQVRSVDALPISEDSAIEGGISAMVSGHVDCVRIEAASDLACEASELVQANEGTLPALLSKVVADSTEEREELPPLRAHSKLETPYRLTSPRRSCWSSSAKGRTPLSSEAPKGNMSHARGELYLDETGLPAMSTVFDHPGRSSMSRRVHSRVGGASLCVRLRVEAREHRDGGNCLKDRWPCSRADGGCDVWRPSRQAAESRQ
jgi:hypothetical protein